MNEKFNVTKQRYFKSVFYDYQVYVVGLQIKASSMFSFRLLMEVANILLNSPCFN